MSHHRPNRSRRYLMHVSLFVALLVGLLGAAAVPPARADGSVGPNGMPPHLNLEEKIRRGEIQVPQMMDQTAPELQRAEGALAPEALTGSIKALAVLVDFSDRVSTVQANFFDSLIFAPPSAGRGSVSDYYSEVSYGQVDIVTLNLPRSLVMLVHSGPGAEYTGSTADIWSHSWYLANYKNYEGVTINRYVIMPSTGAPPAAATT